METDIILPPSQTPFYTTQGYGANINRNVTPAWVVVIG